MRILSILVSLAPVLSKKGHAKKKVGDDINLKDVYHPWADKDDAPHDHHPTSPQHQIGDYMLSTIKQGDSLDTAIATFESYSVKHNLGMTLGDEKGAIIEAAIAKTLAHRTSDVLVYLEFGSHIGDGTLRIIRQLAKAEPVEKCLIFSFDSNQEWLGIGTSIVRHVLAASGTQKCQYIPMMLTDDVSHICHHIMAHYGLKTSATGVFLDHSHAKFHRDIIMMHEKGLVGDGTLVIADNAQRHRSVMRTFIDYARLNSRSFQLFDVKDPYPDQVLVSEWQTKPKDSSTHKSDEL